MYTSQNPPGRSTIVSVALSLLDDETTDRNDTMSVHQWLTRLGEHPTPLHGMLCKHVLSHKYYVPHCLYSRLCDESNGNRHAAVRCQYAG